MNENSSLNYWAGRAYRRRRIWVRLLVLINLLGYLAWGIISLVWAQHGLWKLMLALANILFSAALITWQWEQVQKWIKINQVRWTLEQTYRFIIIFCLVALLNWHAQNYKHHIDLSGIGIFQLSPESQRVLAKIPGKVEFIVFGNYALWEPLLRLYALHGPDKISKMAKVDPALRPDLVQQYNITHPDSLVVLGLNGFAQVEHPEELAVTNALIKVSRKHLPRVAYVVGHGELDFKKTTPEGGEHLFSLLKKMMVNLEPLALAQFNEISSGIDTILLLGPQQDLHPSEIQVLDQYLKKGGNLVLALNPTIKKVDHNPRLRQWLRRWGIALDNTLVVDPGRAVSGSNGVIPIVSQVAEHPITANLDGDVFFPVASAIVNLKENADTASAQFSFLALAKTLPSSWADRRPWEFVEQLKLKYTEGEDLRGPITLAAAVTLGKSKVALFGTSALWQNNYQSFLPNFELLLNAVAWQTEQDLIGEFNLAVGENRPLQLTGWQFRMAFGGWAVGFPLVLVGVAVFIFVRRRSL